MRLHRILNTASIQMLDSLFTLLFHSACILIQTPKEELSGFHLTEPLCDNSKFTQNNKVYRMENSSEIRVFVQSHGMLMFHEG